MNIEPRTLKGFRDFLPKEARKRQYVINTLRGVFESYGFEPLETPVLEYAEILEGKYGEEGDMLMYKFEDNGKRRVAMRYDQTVPLARVVAQYQNDLPLPFKRYQISNVWRAENTQKGRFREFTQCDIDTVGTNNLVSDAEIIEIASTALKKLGFKNPQIWINDRTLLDDLGWKTQEIAILDKLEKIGKETTIEELKKSGRENAAELLERTLNAEPTERLKKLFELLEKLGLKNGEDFLFVPNLARGLNYYNNVIFEAKILNSTYLLSVGGGGRYDNLIGMFAGRDIPAVGFAFGFDRLIEVMEEQGLLANIENPTKVLVTVFEPTLLDKSIEACEVLNKANISQELYVDPEAKMDRQLKYANQKEIKYVVIIGPKEAESNTATVKNLQTSEQTTIQLSELPNAIK